MSNSNSEEATASSERAHHHHLDYNTLSSLFIPISPTQSQPKPKKKRSQPGNPDPEAEVVALSPKTLMATNRFVCEICSKGFQRDQNLQLHRRGHNLPWRLRQRSSKELVKKRVYVCPEATCVHHQPSRALGDLTGIKKHYFRKHGEKKWRCEKCSKRYAVHSDWKAHVKTCGTKEYRCDCGILFARKDSFITHRAFCDALAEESARLNAYSNASTSINNNNNNPSLFLPFVSSSPWDPLNPNPNPMFQVKTEEDPCLMMMNSFENYQTTPPPSSSSSSQPLSATALLQKACTMGPALPGCHVSQLVGPACSSGVDTWQRGDKLTRDFLGAAAGDDEEEAELMTLTSGLGVDHSSRAFGNFGFGLPTDDECPCLM